MQRFANQTGLAMTVGSSASRHQQVEPIEHRLFAFITMNWRGKPLVSHKVIIQLIASTTTGNGLTVTCDIDALAIHAASRSAKPRCRYQHQPHSFHGEWNYTIAPNQQSL